MEKNCHLLQITWALSCFASCGIYFNLQMKQNKTLPGCEEVYRYFVHNHHLVLKFELPHHWNEVLVNKRKTRHLLAVKKCVHILIIIILRRCSSNVIGSIKYYNTSLPLIRQLVLYQFLAELAGLLWTMNFSQKLARSGKKDWQRVRDPLTVLILPPSFSL